MTRSGFILVPAALCLALATPTWPAEDESPADLVAQLRSGEDADRAWPLVVDLGEKAIPPLRKLLQEGDAPAKARAAALLYRLGEAKALDHLAALLDSDSEEARREAADALLAYVGAPRDFDPAAPPDRRAKALARWRAWWKDNRDAAVARDPMSKLHGKVLKVQEGSDLAAVSLSSKHGAQNGTELNVYRGEEAVCLMRVVMAAPTGSVARIVDLSVRKPPRAGDPFFATPK
ncbi:MAG: HEAT repeat domain-containing protein [Candidatus Brocadiia bacterium]